MSTCSTPTRQAYRALSDAAEAVGAYQWWRQRRRGARRYTPTQGHRELVAAMVDLNAGRITPEDAVWLAWWGGEGAEEHRRARAWEESGYDVYGTGVQLERHLRRRTQVARR